MRGSSISELTEVPTSGPELEVLEEEQNKDTDDERLLLEAEDGTGSAGRELVHQIWESRLDWAAFTVLLGLAIAGALLTPYAFYVNEQYVQNYMYPYRHSTVPLPGVLVRLRFLCRFASFCMAQVSLVLERHSTPAF